MAMAARKAVLFERHGEELQKCRSCDATVFWIKTKTGKNMPVNYPEMTSHFATCPHAKRWRQIQKRRRERQKGSDA